MIKEQEILSAAIQHHQAGDLPTAEKLYMEILHFNPNNDKVLYFLGIMAHQVRNFEAAINCFNKAISINSKSDYYRDLGNVFFDINRMEEAFQSYQKAAELNPDDAEIYYNLGLVCQHLRRFDDAIKYFDSATRLSPQDAEIYSQLGSLNLNYKQDFDKALDYYKKALTINPNIAETHFNIGLIYHKTEKFDEAIEKYKQAVQLNPNNAAFYINLGGAYQEKNEIDTAIMYYKKGLEIDPEQTTLLFNLGCCLLKSAKIDEGWPYYENRMKLFPHHKLKLSDCPKWEGQDISGKSIYLYHAAGIGDTLMFGRYLPLISKLGAKIYCEFQPTLHKLFKDSGLLENINLINSIDDLKDVTVDYQVSFMSLANAFKTKLESIPFPEGYLKADPDKVKYYKEKFFNTDKFKLGIVWQSSQTDNIRSVSDIKYFYPLMKIDGVKVYSLQKGPAEAQLRNLPDGMDVTDLGATFNDFADTAAAVENLDLLVTVDTSVTHIAGGLGKKACVVLPVTSDWKWQAGSEYCIWYKSLEVITQKEFYNWDEVVERLVSKVNNISG